LTQNTTGHAREAAHEGALSRSDRRTLEALFRHPLAHNLAWSDVVALFTRIGTVEEKPNHEYVFQVHDQTHVLRRPHSKELTGQEVIDLRHFATRAGVAPGTHAAAHNDDTAAPNLVVVMDHHEAKIYETNVSGADLSEHTIRPYDPHHFLHHLTHKDESRERGQRSPEDATFYERISQAVAAGGKILLVGHGTGKSNAAHHLEEYLRDKHSEIHQRLVVELDVDLSSATPPQLLALARKVLR
jgi:hypothetical protein